MSVAHRRRFEKIGIRPRSRRAAAGLGAVSIALDLPNCNDNAIPDECEPGDFDGNGNIGLADFAEWDVCMTGPGSGPVAGCCLLFDFDADGDVDQHDFAAFQLMFTGD